MGVENCKDEYRFFPNFVNNYERKTSNGCFPALTQYFWEKVRLLLHDKKHFTNCIRKCIAKEIFLFLLPINVLPKLDFGIGVKLNFVSHIAWLFLLRCYPRV